MELKEVIVLAGGLGTRLRSEINDLPKCLAPINGEPFLHYLLEFLVINGLSKFIFSLGYRSQDVIDYLNQNYSNLDCTFAVENHPLLTGGAIKFASQFCSDDNVLIVNADTFFDIDLGLFIKNHFSKKSDCSLALKKLSNFDRYGVVNLSQNRIISFEEKKYFESGLINGGIYILNMKSFNSLIFNQSFSFEKDFLEKYVSDLQIFGFEFDDYFIDIGVPDDYKIAQEVSFFNK